MAATRQYYRSEYLDGNAARQINPAKERREYTQRPKQSKPSRAAQLRAEGQAQVMNAPYIAVLAVVTVVCVLMCVAYLNVQAKVSATRVSIVHLESEINTLQAKNNAISYSINSNVDADRIYKVATKELGMKPASDNQISRYKPSDVGYTVQYGDIPSK